MELKAQLGGDAPCSGARLAPVESCPIQYYSFENLKASRNFPLVRRKGGPGEVLTRPRCRFSFGHRAAGPANTFLGLFFNNNAGPAALNRRRQDRLLERRWNAGLGLLPVRDC